jgi:hypothetical protein
LEINDLLKHDETRRLFGMIKNTEAEAILNMFQEQQKAEIERAVALAGEQDDFLSQLLQGLTAKSHHYRENCYQTIVALCEQRPERLYPHWAKIVIFLDSINAFHRAIGVRLLAMLTRVDTEDRFVQLLDRYFALLDDEKIMVARWVVQSVPLILTAKPALKPDIIPKLLICATTHHAPGRLALLVSDVLTVLMDVYEVDYQFPQVISLAELAKVSGSPTARRSANALMAKFG